MIRLHVFGDLEERGRFRGYRCQLCKRFVIGDVVSRQGCESPEAPTADAEASSEEHPQQPPCRHFGERLGEIPCGCGKREKFEPVHQCAIFEICVAHHTGKTLMRFEGKKPAVCAGCRSFEQQATVDSPQ